MALNERLALIITGDARGAVRELEKVGTTAGRELGKAETAADKWSRRLTSGGAAAVGFAALAGGALYSFAQQSEDARLSQEKLDNTMRNSPALANANKDAFNDLASAIQKKTVADDDAVVSAIAVLGQFGATEDQILTLTPLVVDLARKLGVDLDTAAKLVGKSFDGNTGALARYGIQVDATDAKTDAFGATVEALRTTVGGFAEQEGETFSGKVQILKNQLGELAEGVGAGVVDAFSSALGPITKVSDAFQELDPKVQAGIGKFAAYGTAALGAIGATSFLAGQVVKLRTRFLDLDPVTGASTGKLNAFGKAAAGIGIAGAAVGVISGIAAALGETRKSADEAAAALVGVADESLVAAFNAQVEAVDPVASKIEDAAVKYELFQKVAETNVGTAERLRDKLVEQGYSAEVLDEILKNTTATQQQANEDTRVAGEIIDGTTEATVDYYEALEEQRKRLDDTRKAQDEYRDALFGTRDAARVLEIATLDLQGGLAEYDETAKSGTASSEELRRKELELQGQVDRVADAALKRGEDFAKLGGKQLSAADKANIQRDALISLRDTIAPGSTLRSYLDGLINDLNRAAVDRTARLKIQIESNIGTGAGFFEVLNRTDGKAAGGPVSGGRPYLVGEMGPELFVPGTSGTIVPNHALKSASGTPVGGAVYNIQVSSLNPQESARLVLDAIREYERRNGSNWRAA